MFNFNATQFLLEVDVNQPIAGFADKLAYGGKMLLVGMGIVFSVLVLLCLVLYLFNAVSSRLLGAEKQSKPAPKKEAPITAPAVAAKQTNEQEEIIAVIAAAIAAASAENPGAKFRVVSFKRK